MKSFSKEKKWREVVGNRTGNYKEEEVGQLLPLTKLGVLDGLNESPNTRGTLVLVTNLKEPQ